MVVSKAERKMLDKLLGPKLKTIDKNKVSSLTLNKCAYALSSKMGSSVEYDIYSMKMMSMRKRICAMITLRLWAIV